MGLTSPPSSHPFPTFTHRFVSNTSSANCNALVTGKTDFHLRTFFPASIRLGATCSRRPKGNGIFQPVATVSMYSSAGEDSGVRACPGSRYAASPQRSGGTSGLLRVISPYSPAWFTRSSSRHRRPCRNIRHLQPRETKGPVSFPDREGCSSRAPSPPLSLIFHPRPPEGGIAMGTYSLLLADRYSPGSDPKSCRGPSHTLYQPRSGTGGGARRSAPSLPRPRA